MGLIVDTGVVLDIVKRYPSRTLQGAMLEWLVAVTARIAPPCPRGRRVAMFISPGVYRDYRARMSNKVDVTHTSWHTLRKSQFTKPISRPDRLTFTVQSVSTDKVDASDWGGDRFDRPFFELLEAVRQNRAWADHRIIFASRDRDTSARVRDLMSLRDPEGRVHLAESLAACEELVMCYRGSTIV